MSFGVSYNDTDFNLSLPAVLGSNLGGSTALSPTFPTTSTGTSLGHYHYTEDTTNSLKFLNASGTGSGGHQFWHSSSTQAPIKVLETNSIETIINTQFKVDKGSSTTNYLTCGTFASAPIYIILDINPTNPPSNWVLGNVYTIQVGNTGTGSPPLVPDVTYFCKYIDTQAIKVITTSDPNSPTLDSSGITSVLIPISSTTIISNSVLSNDLTITDDTDVSVLSSTDLTFGGTSVLSTIANLTILQKSVFNQYFSLAMYPDGRPPTAPSATIAQQYAYTPSWYFKNTVAGYKINWYIGATNGMVVSDILGLYVAFFNGVNTSNDNAPFVTIYTTPTGVNDYAPGFFHSSCTYVFDGTITANTRYLEFLNLHSCPIPNFYGAILRYMIQSPVQPNPRGTFLPTESVAFFSIGSNSASAVNTTEFAISKFGIMRASGTTEVNFFPN